jgi:peptide-methionine (S)-S-oxide reductase
MNDAHDTRHITTEIATAKPFYYAEDDHQQYLYKNPHGYCGIGGIGVCLPRRQPATLAASAWRSKTGP